jgi:hypothetical protein
LVSTIKFRRNVHFFHFCILVELGYGLIKSLSILFPAIARKSLEILGTAGICFRNFEYFRNHILFLTAVVPVALIWCCLFQLGIDPDLDFTLVADTDHVLLNPKVANLIIEDTKTSQSSFEEVQHIRIGYILYVAEP